MKNWITTVGGILAAVGTIASQAPIPAPYKFIPALIAALGTAMIGGGAKDFNVHSTAEEVNKATLEGK